MDPQKFVDTILAVPDVSLHYGHYLLFRGRELYILQDPSGFPIDEPLNTAYDHWRRHESYKRASSGWIPDARLSIIELAVLVNDTDSIAGEHRKDLAQAWDNSSVTTSRRDYEYGLTVKEGLIVKAELTNEADIRSLLARFD